MEIRKLSSQASLADIVKTLNTLVDGFMTTVLLSEFKSAPALTQDGMIVFADGTSWNPGNGRGIYQLKSGSWVFMGDTGGGGSWPGFSDAEGDPAAIAAAAADGTSTYPSRRDHVHTADHVNLSNKGTNTHAQIDTHISAAAPHTGHVQVAGQIGGTAASPDVRGVRETSGPTLLTLGSVAEGEYLRRSGTNVVGGSPGGVGFNDAEGDPAAIGTAADGTSAYAARRDHVHAGDHVNLANKGTNTHAQIDTHLGASAPHSGHAQIAGQLGGSGSSPDVRGIRETGGPTLLTLGAVADGQYLKRSGTSLVGDTGGGGSWPGFNDAEGDPAAVAGSASDGTSAYPSRRDHVHGGKGVASGLASLDANTVVVEAIRRIIANTSALTATEGYVRWDSTRKHLVLYDAQRERGITPIGWMPYAYPIASDPVASLNNVHSLAVSGGTLAIPVWLSAPMLLQSVSFFNAQSSSQTKVWNWGLYEQYLNNGNAGENTLTRVAYGASAESYSTSLQTVRTINATSAPVFLAPGLYWVTLINAGASYTINVGGVAGSGANLSLYKPLAQYKTVATSPGSTLDLVAATWTKLYDQPMARLNGRVFGQTTEF